MTSSYRHGSQRLMHLHLNEQCVRYFGQFGGERVKITIEGDAKEIAALVLEIQERQVGINHCQIIKDPLTVEGREENGTYII